MSDNVECKHTAVYYIEPDGLYIHKLNERGHYIPYVDDRFSKVPCVAIVDMPLKWDNDPEFTPIKYCPHCGVELEWRAKSEQR